MVRSKKLPPIHPGEILREDFMMPLGISMNKLALDLHVPVTRIAEIVHERRGITPDTALRFGRYFNTSARFWLNAQAAYDLEVAEDELQRTIERHVRPLASTTPGSRAPRFLRRIAQARRSIAAGKGITLEEADR
jgi:addiction module HigA family antidote